jgi:hypothetical protein
MISAAQTPAPRLKAVLHYVIARVDGYGFGQVKLNKTVVRADIEFYRRFGRTITGAKSFQKQQLGPVPNGVLKSLKTLRDEGKVVSRNVSTSVGPRKEFAPLAEPPVSEFTAEEIDVLNIAISHLQRVTASEASDETHDLLWDEVTMMDQIPVSAAAFKPSQIDSDVLAWALAPDA